MSWETRSGAAVAPSAHGSYSTSPRDRHHRPGEDDVLADRVRPAPHRANVVRPVRGEGALGDQGAVVGRLHSLDPVDSEPVVPALHPGQQVARGVLDYQGARAGADMLPSGFAHQPADQILQSLWVQKGVGVDGDHDRSLDALQRSVERPPLSRFRLEDAPQLQTTSPRRLLGDLGGAVGRVVVGEDRRERPAVGEVRDPLQGRPDGRLLVPGGDHDGHRGPRTLRPRATGWIQRWDAVAQRDQREDHEADEHGRDVGEEDRDHPGHHRTDRIAQLCPPWRRRPDGECHVGGGQPERHREPERRGGHARQRSTGDGRPGPLSNERLSACQLHRVR